MNKLLDCDYPSCIESYEDAPTCIKCKTFQHNIEIDIHWKPVLQTKPTKTHKVYHDDVFRKMLHASSLIKSESSTNNRIECSTKHV